jgi:hypothetical protein
MSRARNSLFTLSFLALVWGILETGSDADELFCLETNNNQLIRINTTTGTGTAIGVGEYEDASGGGNGVGLAFNPSANVMYARSESNLYTVDLRDGSTTLVGGEKFINITGLTFDKKFEVLYSIGLGSGLFFEIDPKTGDHDFIGGGGVFTFPIDLATHSNGTVFVADNSGNIFTANTNTGVLTLVASGLPGLVGIAFDSNDVLFAIEDSNSLLGIIDLDFPATFTPIGTGIQFNSVRGLAFVPDTVANQYNVFRGFHVGGALSDTFESDDSYLKFNPGITFFPTEPPSGSGSLAFCRAILQPH